MKVSDKRVNIFGGSGLVKLMTFSILVHIYFVFVFGLILILAIEWIKSYISKKLEFLKNSTERCMK